VTTTIGMEMNLDARAGGDAAGAGAPIDFADPTHLQQRDVADRSTTPRQGVALTYYFQKAAPTPGTSTSPPTARRSRPPAATGGVDDDHFPPNGGTPTAPAGTVAIDIPRSPTPSARYAADHRHRARRLGATQYGSAFGVTDLSQDGYAPGQLIGVQIEATASSWRATRTADAAGRADRARDLPQPAGPAAARRQRLGGELRVGRPARRRAGAGNFGVLQAGALEESNVDLTAELVDMITAQRVYQANAQTIKTQDQILQTIVNLR
jgi:flagellar hook protein FlgE